MYLLQYNMYMLLDIQENLSSYRNNSSKTIPGGIIPVPYLSWSIIVHISKMYTYIVHVSKHVYVHTMCINMKAYHIIE